MTTHALPIVQRAKSRPRSAGPATYEKARSILSFRDGQTVGTAIKTRIESIHRAVAGSRPGSYFGRIVQRACNDILSDRLSLRASRFRLQPHIISEMSRVSDADLPRYLFYRYRYDVLPRLRELDEFPPCLQIEPTSRCNYRCVFCYQTQDEFTSPRNGHMGHMKLDLFKQIIDEAEGRCDAVTLASRGEPLLCPSICDMLSYMQGKFLASKMNTNAWHLDEARSHAILSAGISTIVFSADAGSEPRYSLMRPGGRLDRVFKNVRRFRDIRARHYADSVTLTRVSGVHYDDEVNVEELSRTWGDIVDQVAVVEYNPWENTYSRPLSGLTQPCSDLWRRTFVWFDGTVNPCDVDYLSTLKVGSLVKASIGDIWSGEHYQQLREEHRASKRQCRRPCNRCVVT